MALCGALHTQSRAAAAKLAADPCRRCRFCAEEDEDASHIFLRCPRWASQRKVLIDNVSEERRNSWPACTRECGLFLEDKELRRALQATVYGAVAPADESIRGPTEADWACGHGYLEQGSRGNSHDAAQYWVYVGLDGAAKYQSDVRLRRGGF